MNDLQLIRVALLNHAELCRHQAARRDMAGPRLATARAEKRAEAKQADALALRLAHIETDSPAAQAASAEAWPSQTVTDRTPALGDS